MEKFIRTIVLGGLLLSGCEVLYAQYLPFAEEGKQWTSHYDLPMPGGDFNGYEWVEGDTVIGDNVCKKLYSRNDLEDEGAVYAGALYEEDGKVYFYPSNPKVTRNLWYDYTLETGDALPAPNDDYCIGDVFTMEIQGITRRIYAVCMGNDVNTYWIEGIGSIQGINAPTFLSGGGSFLSCEVNGKVLYSSDSFFDQLATSVSEVVSAGQAGPVFDLQGRRLDHEPLQGLYIKDGRKVLKR